MAVSSSPADRPERPTVKQVYALAAALCQRHGETFPETRAQASETIKRLRRENGDPRVGGKEPRLAARARESERR